LKGVRTWAPKSYFERLATITRLTEAFCRFAALLRRIFGASRAWTQLRVEPAEGEPCHSLPEPDIAVTRAQDAASRDRHARAEDVSLAAAVADSTYHFDVKRNGRLYARTGLTEYAVPDLSERELPVFRAPRDGVWTDMRVLRPGVLSPDVCTRVRHCCDRTGP
jgi:Uma2 family endonuclease